MKLDDYSHDEINHIIEEYIHDELHRNILKRRLLDNVKYDDLSVEFHYSVRQIKRIVYKSQDKLFRHL